MQLLDELQELTSQAQDLDVALIDKKIDQVRHGCCSTMLASSACVSAAAVVDLSLLVAAARLCPVCCVLMPR